MAIARITKIKLNSLNNSVTSILEAVKKQC